MTRQGREWAITKSDVPPAIKRGAKDDYPEHARAVEAYNHYISGYREEEIADFFRSIGMECTVEEIERDIQHIKTMHPTRVLIAHENDRNRLLLQRTEGTEYRRLLGEALKLKAEQFLAAGISPTSSLREYREAVGMTEKPGGINVHVDQRSLNIGPGATNSGISSSEDLLRSVMNRMRAQNQISQESEVFETEAASPSVQEETFDLPETLEEDDDLIPDPNE